MMAMQKKLKSKSGISLAIALVFFLLCAMVGTVVLAAVSTSAASIARERQLYRQTLALTSAAILLRSEIENMTFVDSYNKVETITTTVTGAGENRKAKIETNETREKETDAPEPQLNGSDLFATNGFKSALADLYYKNEQLYHDPVALESPASFEKVVTFAVDEPEKSIPDVTATLTVAKDYTLTAVMRCGKNCVTLTSKPETDTRIGTPTSSNTQPNSNTAIKTITTPHTTTIRWGDTIIKEGKWI